MGVVKIVDPNKPDDYKVINEEDFDPKLHKLIEDPVEKTERGRKKSRPLPTVDATLGTDTSQAASLGTVDFNKE